MPGPMGMRWARLYRGTRAELAIEPAVARLGVPYRTQFPCFLFPGGLRYFPDFVLPTIGLVIEVDDDSHAGKTQEDAERSAALARVYGWRVVRCTNAEALADPDAAVSRMLREAFPEHEGRVPEQSRGAPIFASTRTPESPRRVPRRRGTSPSRRATRAKRP